MGTERRLSKSSERKYPETFSILPSIRSSSYLVQGVHYMYRSGLDKIMSPKSIALVGASDREGSVGYTLMKNLTELGYEGAVYPINIRKSRILGHKAYPALDQTKAHRCGQWFAPTPLDGPTRKRQSRLCRPDYRIPGACHWSG